MGDIGYGVIGAGFFGEKHIEVLSRISGVKVLAASRRTKDALKAVTGKYGIQKTYADYRELLADKSITAVSITTHVDDHRNPAVDALKAGKHVFLEKPMAGTVEDCEAIIEAAKTAKGVLMVGHICRFDPRVALAKQAVAEGRIGEIVSMHAARNLPARIGASVLDKISALLGDGIHDTDIMMWLTGAKVKSVYAQEVAVRKFKHADIGWAMYRFANGAVGVVESIWCLPDTTPFAIDARMEIIGSKGSINIDCGDAGLTVTDADGSRKPDTMYWPEVHGRRIGILKTEMEYFLDCVRAGKPPTVITAKESRDVVEVMSASARSAAAGEIVRL